MKSERLGKGDIQMSALNNLLSGFLRDKMEDITSAVKDKIEDVLHPDEEENVTVIMAEELTIQNLYHRLGEIQKPMTGEEFIQRMNARGFEAKLFELPENMRKGIPVEMMERRKQYSAKKENYSPLFYAGFWVYKEEAEAAENIEMFRNNLKKSGNQVFLVEEEDRFFLHSTIVTPQDTYKSYNLYSRIGNTLLELKIPEDNADTYAADIVKALQGSGY